MNKVVIIFTGLSIENTPKLNLVKQSLEECGYTVQIKGIVKTSKQEKKPGLYVKGDSQGLLKLFRVFWLQMRLVTHLLFKDKADIYYSINTISGATTLFLRLVKRKKYIYEAHEMVFGVNYPFFRGRWRKVWSALEKRIIRKSAYFFTTDQFRLTFYRRYLGVAQTNAGYLLNVPELTQMEDKNTLRLKYRIEKEVVFSYCGGIIKGRNIEEIIEAYAEMEQANSQLILAGSVEENYRLELEELCKRNGILDNVMFTGFIKNDVLREYMRLSDITFTLYKANSLNNRFSSPNKVFDAIHAGTFFIATSSPLVHEIVSSKKVGKVLNTVSVEELVIQMRAVLVELKDFDYSIFDQVRNQYCWENESKKLKEIIQMTNN